MDLADFGGMKKDTIQETQDVRGVTSPRRARVNVAGRGYISPGKNLIITKRSYLKQLKRNGNVKCFIKVTESFGIYNGCSWINARFSQT